MTWVEGGLRGTRKGGLFAFDNRLQIELSFKFELNVEVVLFIALHCCLRPSHSESFNCGEGFIYWHNIPVGSLGSRSLLYTPKLGLLNGTILPKGRLAQ